MANGAAEPFIDPYLYPGTDALKNVLGKRTREELEHAEYENTFGRRVQLDKHPITGPYDFNRLRETHRRLFQDERKLRRRRARS